MSFFQIISGVKTDIAEREFELAPYIGAFGLTVTGSEVDSDYEIHGTVKIEDLAESVSLIVNFSQNESYQESMVEYMLDVVNQRVAIFLVVDDAKAEVLSREYPVSRNVDYTVGLRAYLDEDGDLVVLCYIGTTEVLRFYYPAAILWQGMWGFKVDGPDGKKGNFKDYFRVDSGGLIFLKEILGITRLSVAQIPYWQGWIMVQDAISLVGGATGQTLAFKTLQGDYRIAVKALAGLKFLNNLFGGGSTSGSNLKLGDFQVSEQQSTSTSVNTSAIAAQLQAEYEAALERLADSEAGSFRAVQS